MVTVEAGSVGRTLRKAMRERLREAAGRLPGPGDAADGGDATWSALVRAGAPALDAPVDAGGMGLGLTASTAVAEELGRAGLDPRYLAVAAAIDATSLTGGLVDGRHPGGDLVDGLPSAAGLVDGLPSAAGLVDGRWSVTLAGFDTPVPPLTAHDGPAVTLTGDLLGDPADLVLAPVTRAGGGRALVLAACAGTEPVRHPSGATARIRLGDARLLPRPGPPGCPEGTIGRARIRQAAYLLGVARGALLTGVRYATDRQQFGRALRDFQSVGFRLAAAHVEVEALRLAVDRAVHLADHDRPYGLHAAEVLAQAAETAAGTSRVTMQLCGARGLTGELPAHRYHLLVRREGIRLGRPGDLWCEAGRHRLTHAGPIVT